jgi:N-acetyl-gamma-glutamyl-phosphate reductase
MTNDRVQQRRRKNLIRAAIIGASGYSGAELMRILSRHKCVTLAKVFANTSAGKRVDEVYPFFQRKIDLVFEPYSVSAIDGVDVVFIALPSGDAMKIVPGLVEKGKRVIDLGGDFRLKDASLYEKYYKREHVARNYLEKSVYGLPEINPEKIARASLIANPGCYPASAILSLAPALANGLINPKGIVINSLSGVSGAGRSASLELSFVEVNESVRAYKVGIHQHTPEIKTVLEEIVGHEVGVTFVPHLIPISRGIYTTVYAELTHQITEEEIFKAFESYYSNASFVRMMKSGIPEIKNVVGTNYCDIALRIDDDNRRLIIISVIDNLVKGAAGNAVQNMNVMLGFPEEEGLSA